MLMEPFVFAGVISIFIAAPLHVVVAVFPPRTKAQRIALGSFGVFATAVAYGVKFWPW
jgi:hypothetical protein